MSRRGCWRIAWPRERGLRARSPCATQKLRSFLTLLGVMAGVATVIMMVSFVVGFNNQVVASFTQFGTYLVQFQKYEPRFGGPDGPPEEQRNRRDLTIEDAQALKRLSKLAAAVSPGALPVRRQRAGARRARGGERAARARRQPRLLGGQHPLRRGRPLHHRRRHHATPRAVAVIGTDVADALFPHRDPIDQELTVNGVRLPGDRHLRAQGRLLRRQQRQLRGHPDHRPSTSSSRRSRTATATPSTSPPCPGAPEDVPGPHRGGDGDPARAPRPAPRPAERLRALHEPGPARSNSSRSRAAWPRPCS